jgi:hypothetical protein
VSLSVRVSGEEDDALVLDATSMSLRSSPGSFARLRTRGLQLGVMIFISDCAEGFGLQQVARRARP